jgi:hypothetical protein
MEKKKNFLFVSLTGLISDIAWQVSKEGHEVRYFIGDKKERDIADGFVASSRTGRKMSTGRTSSYSMTPSAKVKRHKTFGNRARK